MSISLPNIIQQTNIHKNVKWIAVGIVCTLIIAVAISEGNWIYLGLLLIPFITYLGLMKPFLFPFGLYVALLPTEGLRLLMLTDEGHGSSFIKLLGILTVMVLLFKGIFEKKLKPMNSAALWWTLLIVYGVLSVLWAIEPEEVTSKIPTVVGLLILYLVVSSYDLKKSDFDIIKWCSMGGGVVAAIQTFLNYMQNPEMRATLSGHYDTNTTAFAFLIPFAVSTSMMLGRDKTMKKTFGLIAFGVISVGILVTGSRGGLLGAVTIFLIHILYMKQNLKDKVINGVIITIMGFILISFVPDFFSARWETATETGGANRTYIWYIGYKSLEKYWLFGAGMNNFPAAFNEFRHHLLFLRFMSSAPHNIYLGYFVELGIVGLTFVLIAMVKHYQAIRSRFNLYIMDHNMLKASFWGVLVSSIFLHTQLMKSFWLLWTMILMHKNVSEKN